MTVHACNSTDPVVNETADPCPCAGIALTMLRHLPALAKAGLVARDLTAPFARIVDQEVTNPWLRSLMDLECFVLRWGSGRVGCSGVLVDNHLHVAPDPSACRAPLASIVQARG